MKPLNPIMAVLAIASVGVLPLRTLASGGKAPAGVAVKTPAGVAVAAEDANSITKLTEILNKDSKAKDDVGQRVADFLLKPDAAKKSFVAADVDAAALAVVAKDWAKKQTPGNLAMLYFVVGTGPTPPDWVKNDEFLKKTVLPARTAEGRLRTALSRFADAGGAQIKKTGEKDAAVAFLNTAAIEAKKIFDDPRPTPVVDADINQNDNTAANVPDATGGAGSRLDASQPYTMKDLYLDGAAFGDVSGPKDEHSRKISMKIYTKRNADGTTTNEIGIFDITDEENIYGRRFPASGPDQSFVLDDRTPGHKKYELKFETLPGGDRKVIFTRPGGGVPLVSKVSELYNKRADQAAEMRNIVSVGGEEFYALPQGGKFGAVAMFPKKLIDNRGMPGRDPRDLIPELYAEIGQRASDGRNQNLPGKPHLGTVGKNEFHLEFNKALGVWEVKDGPGDKPVPPASGDGAAPGGGAGTNPDGTPRPSPAGGMTLAELLLTFKDSLARGICKINPDDTKDLAKDLKDRYAILACTFNQRDGLKQVVLVPKSEVHPGQQLEYGSVPGFKLLRARFFDHYVVLEFDKQVQYFDLLSYDKDTSGKATGFAISGFVTNGKAVQFTHTDPFGDAMKTYLKNVPAAALTEVPKRVAAAQGNKPYYVAGEFPKDVFIVTVTSNGESYMVWPKVEKPGDAPSPTPNPYTTINGPTNAFDGSVASEDASFPPDIKLPESRKALPIKTQADIALYESDDTPKKYFIMFRYKGLTPKVATQPEGEQVVTTFRQKQLEAFNATNPYPGDSLRMGGLMASPVVKDRVASGYKYISGSTKEKGVLAMFQNKQVSATNAKDGEANCVGPVLWWGLSNEEALKACQQDKF